MKHFIISLIAIIVCATNLQANAYSVKHTESDPEEIDIGIENKEDPDKRERGIYSISSHLFRSSSTLTVELFNIGTATVTVMNSVGVIVSTLSTDTAVPVTLNLPLPGEDSYFIEIISTKYYASGFFNL